MQSLFDQIHWSNGKKTGLLLGWSNDRLKSWRSSFPPYVFTKDLSLYVFIMSTRRTCKAEAIRLRATFLPAHAPRFNEQMEFSDKVLTSLGEPQSNFHKKQKEGQEKKEMKWRGTPQDACVQNSKTSVPFSETMAGSHSREHRSSPLRIPR